MGTICTLAGFLLSIIAFNIEKTNRQKISHNILKITPYLVCFVISLLFSMQFISRPLNNQDILTDSSVFLYIGKSMHGGAIPYKDLFDHKGIVLYFIEYIGYLIGGNDISGIWIMELLNIFAVTIIFYHIAKLFSSNKIICCLTVFLALFTGATKLFQGGNFVEEYALPWIALSLYFVIKFFLTNQYKIWNIVAIGAGFAVVLFLRVNMVGAWIPLLLSVIFSFIHRKKSAEILKCALLFLGGIAAVCIPLLIYFVATNSLYDMIEQYIVFNLSYTGSSATIINVVFFIFQFVSVISVPIFIILYTTVIKIKDKCVWLNLIVLLASLAAALISGRDYLHYLIIIIPFFVIPTALFLPVIMEKTYEVRSIICKKYISVPIVSLCILGLILPSAYDIYINIRTSKQPNVICEYLTKETGSDDDVLILGNDVNYYLQTNRSTKNKFFYQSPPIEVSEKIYTEFIEQLNDNPSDYIIDITSKRFRNEEKYKLVLEYLNVECDKGNYELVSYDEFQVYVRK